MDYNIDHTMENKYRSNKVSIKDKFIGRELKKLRNIYRDESGTIRKLRAFELAEMVGYQQSTISNFENGNKRIPEKLIPKLEEIFKLPEGYFDYKFKENYFKLEKNQKHIKAREGSVYDYEREGVIQALPNEINEIIKSVENEEIKEKLIKIKKNIEKLK